MIWIIGSIVALVLAIIFGVIVLKKSKDLVTITNKTEATLQFEKQTEILNKDLLGNHNTVFKNTQVSFEVIDQFMISEEEHQSFLIIHLKKPLEAHQVLDIHLFDSKKWVKTLRLESETKLEKIPPFELPKGVKHVNFSIYENLEAIEVVELEFEDIHKKYRRFLLLETFTLFLFMIPIGFSSLVFFGWPNFQKFLNLPTFSLGMGLMFGVAVVQYITITVWINKRMKGWRSQHE